jgi:DNA polymerase III sliding clamp (beta) subunit (PCNA family)
VAGVVIDFELMHDAVKRARGTAVLKQAQVESHSWFCLKKGKLSSFNGISGTITNSGAPQELECCVPAKQFAAVTDALQHEQGNVHVEDGWMHIVAGKYKTTIPTHSIFDFPELLPKTYTKICEAQNVADAIKSVLISMETDESKTVVYGCGISGAHVYTTDGKRFTRAQLDSPSASSLSIGRAAARQLVRLGS